LGTVDHVIAVDMTASTSPVDVFKALADPTRLAVIERLGIGTASTSELAEPFDMALPSFTQHLDVLEQSGLVASYKQGRVRTYRLTPAPLERAGEWLGAQREHWTRRFDQLDAHLMTIPHPATALPATPHPVKEPT
jgi:DNA-binding transcriptional ArsR family regulator